MKKKSNKEAHLGNLKYSCADPGRNGRRRFVGLE
jgi:hypothetical protein